MHNLDVVKTMRLPELTQALCQQWQLEGLELVGQALLALTAFGKGEGQLLFGMASPL